MAPNAFDARRDELLGGLKNTLVQSVVGGPIMGPAQALRAVGQLGSAALRNEIDPVSNAPVPATPAAGPPAVQAPGRPTDQQRFEAELEAKFRSQAPQGGGTATQTQTTTTTQSAQLSGEDAAAGMDAAKEAAAGKQQLAAEAERVQRQWAAEADAYAKQTGKRGDAVHKRFMELDRELEAAKKDLGSTKIELMGGFSKTGRAMLIIAAAMESGAAAILQRPSNAAAMLNAAVSADLATQRQNVQLKLRRMQMTERQRASALARWEQLEGDRRATMGRVAQLQLAGLGARQQGVDAKLALANTILKLKDMSRRKSTTVTVRQKVPVGPAAGLPGKLDKQTRNELADAAGLTESLGQLETGLTEQQKSFGTGLVSRVGTWLAEKVPGSESQAFARQRQALGIQMAKAISGAAMNKKEQASLIGRLPDTADAPRVAARKFANVFNELNARLRTKAKLFASEGNLLAAKELAGQTAQMTRVRDSLLRSVLGAGGE